MIYGFITPSPLTIMFVLGLGVLLFGKRLPEVARQVGLSFLELKRGMNELRSTLDVGVDTSLSSRSSKGSSEARVLESEEAQEYLGTKFEAPPQE